MARPAINEHPFLFFSLSLLANSCFSSNNKYQDIDRKPKPAPALIWCPDLASIYLTTLSKGGGRTKMTADTPGRFYLYNLHHQGKIYITMELVLYMYICMNGASIGWKWRNERKKEKKHKYGSTHCKDCNSCTTHSTKRSRQRHGLCCSSKPIRSVDGSYLVFFVVVVVVVDRPSKEETVSRRPVHHNRKKKGVSCQLPAKEGNLTCI